jgi:hypothetical protein
MLTDEQLSHFREQGYVLVPDALSQVGQQRVVRAFEQDATWPTTRRHLPLSSLLEGAEDARIERLETLQVPADGGALSASLSSRSTTSPAISRWR